MRRSNLLSVGSIWEYMEEIMTNVEMILICYIGAFRIPSSRIPSRQEVQGNMRYTVIRFYYYLNEPVCAFLALNGVTATDLSHSRSL